MLTERLRDFLQSWCNPDTQPEEVAEMLSGTSGAYYADWLEGELLTAAQAGELTPQSLEQLTGLWFAGQPEVAAWLRRIWPLWFRRAYPG
jgi:hypothetical protein